MLFEVQTPLQPFKLERVRPVSEHVGHALSLCHPGRMECHKEQHKGEAKLCFAGYTDAFISPAARVSKFLKGSRKFYYKFNLFHCNFKSCGYLLRWAGSIGATSLQRELGQDPYFYWASVAPSAK